MTWIGRPWRGSGAAAYSAIRGTRRPRRTEPAAATTAEATATATAAETSAAAAAESAAASATAAAKSTARMGAVAFRND